MHTEFGLFWTTPCPDEKESFFKILKIRTSRNSQISVWKPNFFPRQAKPNTLFAVHSHYTGDTQYRVWFDLDNSLTRWKRPIFKIPFSRNLKSSVWEPIFFPRQAKPNTLFALHFYYTGDSHYRVWFDLDNSLTRWKRIIFKTRENLQFAKLAKLRIKTHFFSRQAIPTTFLLYTVITLVVLYTEFGLIWITPWPDDNEFFFKIRENSQFEKIAEFRMKTHFFSWQAIPTTFLPYTLITLLILYTEFGLIWTTP